MKINITARILILFLVAGVLTSLLFGIVQYRFRISKFEMEMQEDLNFKAEQLSHILTIPVFNFDYLSATAICTAMLSDRSVRFIRIEDTGLKAMDISVFRQIDENLSASELLRIDATTVTFTREISYRGKYLGIVVIGMSSFFNEKNEREDISLLLSAIAVQNLFLFGLLFFIIRKAVIGPILAITNAAEAIAAGDFSRKLVIRSRNELGTLARTLETLRHNIATSISTMEEEIVWREETEKKITKTLKEKEVLLREIHHRVKNNLTVISGILGLQEDRIQTLDQAHEAFAESQNRIYSMALIHEQLYSSKDYSTITMNTYIYQLIDQITSSHNADNRIRFDLDIGDISFDIQIAVPFGILLNELVTNSFKHAFPDNKQGTIAVSLRRLAVPSEQHIRLIVKDDGVGFKVPPNEIGTGSLGMFLIQSLVQQIKGTLEYETPGAGVCTVITFPYSD